MKDALVKRTTLFASMLLVFAAACGSSGSGSAPVGSGAPASGSGAPASGSGVAATPEADDSSPDDPGIKLLDKGAAPGTKLRYQPADGAVETLLLVQTRSEAFVGEKPRAVPSSKLTIAFTIKGKAANGDREGTYEIKDGVVEQDGAVAPAMARQVQAFLKKAIGMGGTFVISDRGTVRKVTPTETKDADAVTKQFVQGVADTVQVAIVPFPVARVGVGAKWEHQYEAHQSGVAVKMRTTYEVTALSGDEVKLKITDSQKADKQVVEMGPGPKITVSNYTNEGTGEIVLRTTRLTPRSRTGKNQGSMTMEGLPTGKKDIRLNTSITITGT